jgi:hypothetical protein
MKNIKLNQKSTPEVIEVIKVIEVIDDFNRIVTTDEEGRPLSKLYDDEWDFSYNRKFSQGDSVKKVSFKGAAILHRKNIQQVMNQIIGENNKLAVHTMRGIVSDLIRITKCLGHTQWGLLGLDNDFRGFKNKLVRMALSAKTIELTASTINKLSKLGLTTRYISEPKKLSKECACKTKRYTRQHIAIPEKMASSLFSACIDTIERHHAHRHQISNAFGKYFNKREEYLQVNPKFNPSKYCQEFGSTVELDYKGIDVKGCISTLGIIQASCLMVILGFSGTRYGEGVSFDKDSYKVKPFHKMDVPTITGQITKNQEGGVAKQETWITHPITEKAIELAYDMSNFSRNYYEIKFKNDPVKLEEIRATFLNLSIGKESKNVHLSPAVLISNLKEIMRINDVVATEEDVTEFDLINPTRKGELKLNCALPKLSSHDFRRTFAVFLVRNKLGNLMTLKHQYKHFNLMMTEWYTNGSLMAKAMDLAMDDELQDLIFESNVSVTTDSLFDIYNSPTLGGKEGGRLEKERAESGYSGSIYMTREEIERQVRSGSVSVVEHPTGYCFNPSCDRICSSDISSITCQHELVTKNKAEQRIPVRERLIRRFNALNDGQFQMANILTRIALQIEAIEMLLKKHKINFTPFKNKLKANLIAFKEV